MKRNELKEIKNLEPKDIFLKAKQIKLDIAKLRLDKFDKSKSKQGTTNVKEILKKRKDIAQMLTIARQKEMLAELQGDKK